MTDRLSYEAVRQSGMESSKLRKADASSRRKSPPRNAARSVSLEPARLQKPYPASKHARAASGQYLEPVPPPPVQSLQEFRQQYAGHSHLGVPTSVSSMQMGGMHSRNISHEPVRSTPQTRPVGSRPTTPVYSIAQNVPPTPPSSNPSTTGEKKKHGWFSKRKDKPEEHAPLAWIAGHDNKVAYDIDSLMRGETAMELCDNVRGNCRVHLFPPNFDKKFSFKVDSAIFNASPVLSRIAYEERQKYNHPTQTLDIDLFLQLQLSHAAIIHGSPHATAEPTQDDLQLIVDFRNLFAFLCGQSLVATERRSSLFSIFIAIGSLLRAYEFTNADGTTFGEVADASFNNYVDELGLADVRTSREKTVQSIVLGERMRSVALYSEAFTHAVGKLDDVEAAHSAKYNMISPATQTRLTRASLELAKREQAVQLALSDFDFPSIFSGIMNSKTAEERKEGVRFDAWKEAFMNTRKWMLGTLKQQYGDWPPKAKSKKNDLEVSGLQRQVLRQLYKDLCSIYDLLADRTQLTTRTLDGIDRAGPVEAPWVRALRSVLSEYDRSSPPVKPPVPFDLPKLANRNPDTKLASRKLKDEEIAVMLRASWNEDAIVTPFVNAFRDMEKRAAHGCTMQELFDLRLGQWIFFYAVIQALPMLACDAPGLKYTNNVESFLCIAPRDGVPWTDPQKAAQRKTWFAVGDAGSVVSLPAHLLEHGTEGVYRRSHCWQMAEKWAAANPILNQALQEQTAAAANTGGLPLPRTHVRSRSASPARHARNSSLNMGLEMLSLGPDVHADVRQSTDVPQVEQKVDSSKTFDAIFATMDNSKPKRK